MSEYERWRMDFLAMIDEDLYPADWLDEQVRSGEFILFSGEDAAILCSIRVYPSGVTEFHGQAGVGNLATIVGSLIPQAETYAKKIGCRYGSIASREGWSKVMKAHGYELYQTEIRKVL